VLSTRVVLPKPTRCQRLMLLGRRRAVVGGGHRQPVRRPPALRGRLLAAAALRVGSEQRPSV